MAETKTSEIKAGDRRLTLEVTHDEVKALAGEATPRTTRMSFRVRDEGGVVLQKGVVTHDRGIAFAKNDRTVAPDDLTRALMSVGAPLQAPKAKTKVTSQEALKKQAKQKKQAPKSAAAKTEPKAEG